MREIPTQQLSNSIMSDLKSNDDEIKRVDQKEKASEKDLLKENEGEKTKKLSKNPKSLRRETVKLETFKKRPSIQLSDGPYRMKISIK